MPIKIEKEGAPAQGGGALWWLKAVLEDLEKEGSLEPEPANPAVPEHSGEPRPKLRKLKNFKL